MFSNFRLHTNYHFITSIFFHAEKQVQFHFMAAAKKFCNTRFEFFFGWKCFQMPQSLKCVMIGLSCKRSLTFHYVSCLSSLMATALRSDYIRDIYSRLAWLAHTGTCLKAKVKVCGWGPTMQRITARLLISSRQPFRHLSEVKRPFISA